MKVAATIVFGTVPAGTRLWLTDRQASAREHAITETKPDGRSPKDRKLYTANQPLTFSAGEEFAIEGDLDRNMERMFGWSLIDAKDRLASAEKLQAEAAEAQEQAAAALEEGTTQQAAIEKTAAAAKTDEDKAAAAGAVEQGKQALEKLIALADKADRAKVDADKRVAAAQLLLDEAESSIKTIEAEG